MKDLFEIGYNDDGYYAYPSTNPPQYQTPKGDETDFQQACKLCKSLNHSVKAHISQLAINDPMELLREIARYWSWRCILKFISDLLWHRYLDTPGTTPQGTIYQNMMAVDRVVASWLR